MFTGIVEEVGQIKSIGSDSISVLCREILSDIKVGDSVAVDGVCLTVTTFDNNGFVADVSSETKNVTKLSGLNTNDLVNLERAMLLTSRFGGHIVSGHVDCVAQIAKFDKVGEFYNLEIVLPSNEFKNYIVKKGSITIDGISLTIADCSDMTLRVAVIPHTYENTALKTYTKGTKVNIEFDILAKYVEKNLLMNYNSNNITEDFLKDNGFM